MDTTSITQFDNGREMWNYFGNGIHYNPMENVHLACNTRLNTLIENKAFDKTDRYHDSLIEQARCFLMRVKIHDTLILATADSIHDQMIYEFEHAQNADFGDIPDIWDLWDGFTTEQHKEVANKYVGLLDPLTLRWIDPMEADYNRKKNEYTFTRFPAVAPTDPTFCYEEKKPKTEDDQSGWYGVYEYATEDYQNLVPSKVYQLYRDIEERRY